jgi:hypothetical protein
MEETMTQLILTEEQAKLIRNANGPVQICDPKGNVVGQARPNTPLDQLDAIDREAVENHIKRRQHHKEKGYSSNHMRATVDALEKEWERTGGFDISHLDAFLARWRVKNPA